MESYVTKGFKKSNILKWVGTFSYLIVDFRLPNNILNSYEF